MQQQMDASSRAAPPPVPTASDRKRQAANAARAMEDSDDEPEQLQFKVILLGDGAVGKTSIAMRFTEDHFAKQYKQTIGVDFFIKRLVLPGEVHAALQIWDIGGQTIGGKMIGNYIYGADAVLLCYDITNYESFQNLEDWYRLVQRTFQGVGDTMPRVTLIGNKTDLNHMRMVKVEKHNLFADENDMYSCFMSAKTGDNVDQCFFRVAADLSGVTLTKPEIEVASKIVTAQIVNHPLEDESDASQTKNHNETAANRSKGSGCVVQ
ncbi:hypothetical protein AB1Y20_015291 [Prymnesium parvum]|uniref:Ras-related protein Rab-28 n=1 Tax=Prymnesium parvum TaxID=97485 RepID=A0AB34K0Z2_PRYPA